jgi:hypothetical protein
LSAGIDLDRAQRLRWYATLKDRDPLAYWHHQSEESRVATRFLGQAEVFARWPNWTGKTNWAASAVVSMLQGRDVLDGIPLPKVPKPSAAVLVLDYEQHKFSVQPTYLEVLGDWPHVAKYKGDNILSTLRVKPIRGGDDPMGWPLVSFLSQENRNTGVGARVPIVHADEPPVERIWRELRKSKRAGDVSAVRIITGTPLYRSQQWLEEDFKGCQGQPFGRRVDVHMSDVRHCALVTPARYQELLDEYRGDPFIKARLTANYVIVDESWPWLGLEDTLAEMLAACREPARVLKVPIKREVDSETGRTITTETVEVELWGEPVLGRKYYLPIDPSEGIDDGRHDPGAIHCRRVANGDLEARHNSYIGAYGLGSLGAILGLQYNLGTVDPETTGGYGGPCLSALSAAGYTNVAHAKRELSPGQWETVLGFKTSAETRPAMFEAIRQWMLSWRAGHRYANCPSAAVLRSIGDMALDDKGKPVKAPGYHIEDAILWGQGLKRLCQPKSGHPPLRQGYEPPQRIRTIADLTKMGETRESPRAAVRMRRLGR